MNAYEAKFTEREAELIVRGLRLLWLREKELVTEGGNGLDFSYTAELLSVLERRWGM